MSPTPESILACWFGDDLVSPEAIAARIRIWFSGDPAFDEQLRERFDGLPDRALRGELDSWRGEARTCLALVLVVDQLPRNLYRGTERCFAYDSLALEVATTALRSGFDAELSPMEAAFLYLPLEHSEDLTAQDRCVALFRNLVDCAPAALQPQLEYSLEFAIRHREVIRRFGRFPHRNKALARASTPEELDYLESGGESWGQGG